MGVCPTPAMADPEAPSPEVLRPTCRVISGSPALGLGPQGHRRPWATPAHMPMPMRTRIHTTAAIRGPDRGHGGPTGGGGMIPGRGLFFGRAKIRGGNIWNGSQLFFRGVPPEGGGGTKKKFAKFFRTPKPGISLSLPHVFGFGRCKEGIFQGKHGYFRRYGWYLCLRVPCCCFLVDGCCYFPVASGWWLIFLEGLLLQPMSGAHSLTHRILKLEGNIWYEVGLPNLSTSNLSPPKLPPPPPVCKAVGGVSGGCQSCGAQFGQSSWNRGNRTLPCGSLRAKWPYAFGAHSGLAQASRCRPSDFLHPELRKLDAVRIALTLRQVLVPCGAQQALPLHPTARSGSHRRSRSVPQCRRHTGSGAQSAT